MNKNKSFKKTLKRNHMDDVFHVPGYTFVNYAKKKR